MGIFLNAPFPDRCLFVPFDYKISSMKIGFCLLETPFKKARIAINIISYLPICVLIDVVAYVLSVEYFGDFISVCSSLTILTPTRVYCLIKL